MFAVDPATLVKAQPSDITVSSDDEDILPNCQRTTKPPKISRTSLPEKLRRLRDSKDAYSCEQPSSGNAILADPSGLSKPPSRFSAIIFTRPTHAVTRRHKTLPSSSRRTI